VNGASARRTVARARREGAYLYGEDAASQPGTGGLNAFFLLVDQPEVYNLPPAPVAQHASARKLAGDGDRRLGMVAIAALSVLTGRGR